MTKEEYMLALEQIILELPQYRKITNEMCNTYISDYVRNEYEQRQIYIEGNHESSRDYCWDIYDTVPIEIIESILDNFKKQDNVKEENTAYKQALIDIREMIIKYREVWFKETERKQKWLYIQDKSVLQIIDKVLGGSDE